MPIPVAAPSEADALRRLAEAMKRVHLPATWVQFLIALIALAVMGLQFMKLPAKLFGVGHYTVTMQLLGTGGLYESSNVTYRGTEVGRVTALRLTDSGVVAVPIIAQARLIAVSSASMVAMARIRTLSVALRAKSIAMTIRTGQKM